MPPRPRPAHPSLRGRLSPALLLAVAAGGTLGTLVRATVAATLTAAGPPVGADWPWATLAVNITGSALLGALVQALALRGPDEGRRRLLRLGLGTGLLGGYTTYSSFAVETATLGSGGHLALAATYDAVSLAVGYLAAALGFLIADAHARRSGRSTTP